MTQGKKSTQRLAQASEAQPTGRRAAQLLEEEQADEARQERLASLRSEIAAGRYEVDNQRVAAALCNYITGLNEARRRD